MVLCHDSKKSLDVSGLQGKMDMCGLATRFGETSEPFRVSISFMLVSGGRPLLGDRNSGRGPPSPTFRSHHQRQRRNPPMQLWRLVFELCG